MNLHVIATGSPFEGISLHGLYDDADYAAQVADGSYHASPWWVLQIDEGVDSIDVTPKQEILEAIEAFESDAAGNLGYGLEAWNEFRAKFGLAPLDEDELCKGDS